MLPKGKKGEGNNAYCTLRYESRSFRTRTVHQKLRPQWNEQYFFDVFNLDGTISLYMWHDEHDGILKSLVQDDQFLGKIDIPLETFRNPKISVIEEW